MSDAHFMRNALNLAALQRGKTGENPAVGCLIVSDGAVIAGAATADGGRPHAEEAALAEAGARAKGATAYVTLEPCARRSAGGTACADALIQAGVARVVIASEDPHPNAAGAGLERLRAAGIAVELGLLREEAEALNADFIARWKARP